VSAPTETWIIDRFEGDRAVVERALHDTFAWPRAFLPAGTAEGDVLRVAASSGGRETRLTITRDEAATTARGAEARAALDALRARGTPSERRPT